MKAIWNNKIIAQSDKTVVIEGNHYFPKESLNMDYVQKSDLTSVCHWKGTANYYNLEIDGEVNAGAVWYYDDPSEMAKAIKDHVAFWKGVQISE